MHKNTNLTEGFFASQPIAQKTVIAKTGVIEEFENYLSGKCAIDGEYSHLVRKYVCDGAYRYKVTDETIKETLWNAIGLFGNDADLNWIDVSDVTDMREMFKRYEGFCGDVSRWDTSNVFNMFHMFDGCEKFNCDLSRWDTSKVTCMDGMFYGCEKFNCDLSRWDVSNVTNMSWMFYGCKSFSRRLQWVVSSGCDTGFMFYGTNANHNEKKLIEVI